MLHFSNKAAISAEEDAVLAAGNLIDKAVNGTDLLGGSVAIIIRPRWSYDYIIC